MVGAEAGPTGGQKLTKTTHIQRLNTTGGKPPSSPCGQGELGKELVEYTADYYFYKNCHDTSVGAFSGAASHATLETR